MSSDLAGSGGGVLTVDGVSVRYDETVAVDDVTLTVGGPGNQVLALLGPSGCGKSTLLRAIAGLEPLSAGRLLFDGVDLARVPTHRREFGLVFQDGQLFPHRTVAGNIGYGLRGPAFGRGRAARVARSERIDELLALVGLEGYGDRRVRELSGGQSQRVALARALAPRPRLLLRRTVDDPSSDEGVGSAIGGTLRSINRDGGARVRVGGGLYGTVKGANSGSLYQGWGRFWR